MTETKQATTKTDQPDDDELSPAQKAAEKKLLEANAATADEAARAVGRPRARAEAFRGKDGYYVRVVAANGEKTFVSEAHKNAADAVELAYSSFPTLPIVDLTKEKAES